MRLGTRVPVRLTESDPVSRTVRFALADGAVAPTGAGAAPTDLAG
jgi:hypothetical protein